MTDLRRPKPNRIDFLSWCMMQLVNAWHNIALIWQRLFKDGQINELMDMAAVYFVQHPIIALLVFVMALCCGIPILMFVAFAVITFLLTFTGFLVVEGTLLTVASVLLCGLLLGMLLVMFTLAAIIVVAYLGFLEVYGLLQNGPENSPVSHFLSRHDIQIFKKKNEPQLIQHED